MLPTSLLACACLVLCHFAVAENSSNDTGNENYGNCSDYTSGVTSGGCAWYMRCRKKFCCCDDADASDSGNCCYFCGWKYEGQLACDYNDTLAGMQGSKNTKSKPKSEEEGDNSLLYLLLAVSLLLVVVSLALFVSNLYWLRGCTKRDDEALASIIVESPGLGDNVAVLGRPVGPPSQEFLQSNSLITNGYVGPNPTRVPEIRRSLMSSRSFDTMSPTLSRVEDFGARNSRGSRGSRNSRSSERSTASLGLAHLTGWPATHQNAPVSSEVVVGRVVPAESNKSPPEAEQKTQDRGRSQGNKEIHASSASTRRSLTTDDVELGSQTVAPNGEGQNPEAAPKARARRLSLPAVQNTGAGQHRSTLAVGANDISRQKSPRRSTVKPATSPPQRETARKTVTHVESARKSMAPGGENTRSSPRPDVRKSMAKGGELTLGKPSPRPEAVRKSLRRIGSSPRPEAGTKKADTAAKVEMDTMDSTASNGNDYDLLPESPEGKDQGLNVSEEWFVPQGSSEEMPSPGAMSSLDNRKSLKPQESMSKVDLDLENNDEEVLGREGDVSSPSSPNPNSQSVNRSARLKLPDINDSFNEGDGDGERSGDAIPFQSVESRKSMTSVPSHKQRKSHKPKHSTKRHTQADNSLHF